MGLAFTQKRSDLEIKISSSIFFSGYILLFYVAMLTDLVATAAYFISFQQVANKEDERYIVNWRNNLCCWIIYVMRTPGPKLKHPYHITTIY